MQKENKMDLQAILITALFFGLPIGAVIWFVVSLVLFLQTPKDDPRFRGRKIRLIISGVLAGVLVAAVVSLIILMMLVITHM